MNPTIVVAIISAAAAVIAATISIAFTKRAERKDVLQQRKLNHYQELLSGISDLAIDSVDKDEANLKFARSVNTIALVAPQEVINALLDFHAEIKYSNMNKSPEAHDQKLRQLLLAMRRDLNLPFKDDPNNFNFHLIGSGPPGKK